MKWDFHQEIRILFKTIWVVAKGEGLYADRETDDIAKAEDNIDGK